MFERRLKVFLAILILLTAVLIARAVQMQVFQRQYWTDRAADMMTHPISLETTRGRLHDRNGMIIAEDEACTDACVDFRALESPPDAKWVASIAQSRLRNRLGSADYRALDKSARAAAMEEERRQVLADIDSMWDELAKRGHMTRIAIEEVRTGIVRKVELRRRYLWYWRYQQALQVHQEESRKPAKWYDSFLGDDGQGPDVDQYEDDVAEERDDHVILRAIDSATANELGKKLDQYPGLSIGQSMHRRYPYNEVAAHVIGMMTSVSAEDVKNDPLAEDYLKHYRPNDQIGRTGLEALCEPLLRGTRGRIAHTTGDGTLADADHPPEPGQDVKTTIDIELQHDIQEGFKHVLMKHTDPDWEDEFPVPGAAVVIDIPTGEVLAMVSYPTYDLNTLDQTYAALSADDANRPLMNRATLSALEPGSTAKPMVGLGAITQGVFPTDGTIQCTGYLVIDGHTYTTFGRCWTMKIYNLSHMQTTPSPHPTGFLTFSDALERSCNVFFETLANKLGTDGLRYWFSEFGLGRPTGIGLPERSGSIPGDQLISPENRRAATWLSGIGQSQVLATPIQMANVAATIGREGIWVRPRLLPAGTPITIPSAEGPDRVDLHLSPVALAEAKVGMKNVVNGPAGTGKALSGLDVAGKTGTAQAARLSIPKRDESGELIYKIVQVPTTGTDGKPSFLERKRRELFWPELGTHENPNPDIPWYRGWGDAEGSLLHAWYIGYAPADHPRIAFAVLVEYGGSGGPTAGAIAKRLLAACKEHGYLPK